MYSELCNMLLYHNSSLINSSDSKFYIIDVSPIIENIIINIDSYNVDIFKKIVKIYIELYLTFWLDVTDDDSILDMLLESDIDAIMDFDNSDIRNIYDFIIRNNNVKDTIRIYLSRYITNYTSICFRWVSDRDIMMLSNENIIFDIPM